MRNVYSYNRAGMYVLILGLVAGAIFRAIWPIWVAVAVAALLITLGFLLGYQQRQ